MDLQEFWQENKRWLLSAVLGVAVFFVAKGVIESTFLDQTVLAQHRRLLGEARGERYGREALQAAQREADALKAEEARLLQAVAFDLGEDFELAGRSDPAVYFTELDARLRKDIRDELDARDVGFEARALDWATPQNAGDVRAMMLGMNLMNEAFQRLLQAHDAVRDADPVAFGLSSVERLKIDTALAHGGRRGIRRTSGGRRSGPELPEGSQEETVTFRIEVDGPTLHAWLERCRGQQPPIGLRDLSVKAGKEPEDPLVVSGTLAAVLFPED